MGLHRCDEADCCYTDQPSPRECGCHQSDEQVLRDLNAELQAALREAHRALSMYEWYANPKSGWAPADKTTVRGTVEGALALAQGIEARSGETGTGSIRQDESPVAASDAP